MNRGDCHHPSAFCLLTFRTPGRDVEEVIWNSRDQAVPASISHGEITLHHVDAHRDEFRPYHVPTVGRRIFIDPVLDRAEAAAEAFFAEHQHDKGFANEWGHNQRDAIAKLIAHELQKLKAEGVEPAAVLVTVTADMAAKIQARLEKRGAR